jgi:hypothetical protein
MLLCECNRIYNTDMKYVVCRAVYILLVVSSLLSSLTAVAEVSRIRNVESSAFKGDNLS